MIITKKITPQKLPNKIQQLEFPRIKTKQPLLNQQKMKTKKKNERIRTEAMKLTNPFKFWLTRGVKPVKFPRNVCACKCRLAYKAVPISSTICILHFGRNPKKVQSVTCRLDYSLVSRTHQHDGNVTNGAGNRAFLQFPQHLSKRTNSSPSFSFHFRAINYYLVPRPGSNAGHSIIRYSIRQDGSINEPSINFSHMCGIPS